MQYLLAPFGGSAIALIFYEFVFVKSQEYLEEGEDDDETDADNDELADGLNEEHAKGQRTVDED